MQHNTWIIVEIACSKKIIQKYVPILAITGTRVASITYFATLFNEDLTEQH